MQIGEKYYRILDVIFERQYWPYGHQRYCNMLERAFVSELKKYGWTRHETHAYSPYGGQRYFDGYEYRHANGMTIKPNF